VRIVSLTIRNFASFGSPGAELGDLPPVAAFIGENNAGKSNIFRAIRTLTMLPTGGGFPGGPTPASGWTQASVFHEGGNDPAQISACFELNQRDRELARVGDTPYASDSYYWGVAMSRFAAGFPGQINAQRVNESGGPIALDNAETVVANMILGRTIYVESRRSVFEENVPSGGQPVEFTGEGRGFKQWLAAFLAARTRIEQKAVTSFKSDLRSIPTFEELDLAVDASRGRLDILVSQGPMGYRCLIEECGFGLQMVVLVLAAVYAKRGGIALIDDIESALHPTAQGAFVRTLVKRALEGQGQVLLATHSPAVLDAVPEDAIFEVRRSNASSAVIATGSERARLLEVLRGFGYRPALLRLANCVLFVEGPSDAIIIREFWEKLFDEQPEPAVAIFDLGGADMKHLSVESVQALGRDAFALIDSERKSAQAAPVPDREAFRTKMDGVVKTHLTQRRSIENYLSPVALAKAIGQDSPPSLEHYERVRDVIPNYRKVLHARTAARVMNAEDIDAEIVDFLTEVRSAAHS
jgi:AAA domain, putative AbiEii toxin, Type IV TA system